MRFTVRHAAIAVLIIAVKSYAQVVINEFMAFSAAIYPDMCDYDDFSDWIELRNTSDSAVDLRGYYLTDDFDEPLKWAFPNDAGIPAGGFLVVRADGMNAKPGTVDTLDSYPWNKKFTTRRYHAPFKLSEDGEEIGLYRMEGNDIVRVDSVVFTNQFVDVSTGRNPSDGDKWYRFDQPTPGAANLTDAKTAEVSSGSVSFSIAGGFYDAPQSLTMTAGSGEIHYTTDGSIPFKSSSKYISPITVDRNTVIRARCIEPDKLAGKVTTATYFINEKRRSLMTIAVTADTSYLYSEDLGVFENSWKSREVPVALEFFTPDGKQVQKVNAGITIGSLTNFNCPQKPLQVRLRGGTYGDDYIWYRLFDKQIACFERLRLRQGGDGWETNLITDGMLEAMSRGQLEFGVQAYRPVVVFINGSYYGIHDLREQFDDQFFIGNYNVDPSTKEEVKSTFAPVSPGTKEVWELVSGSWDDYQAMIDMAKDGVTGTEYAVIKDRVNINSLCDFVGAVAFANQISWGHNEDLWKVKNSKWQWLVTDFDRCFVYEDSYTDYRHNTFTEKAGVSGSIIGQDTLFTGLIGNDEYRHYFSQRLAAHLNSTFRPSRMIGIVDSLKALLSPEMEEYTAKWGPEGGVGSVKEWSSYVDSVKMFINARPGYVFEFLTDDPFGYSGTAEVAFALTGEDGGDIYVNGVRLCAGLDSLRFLKGAPMEVRAVARPGFVFAGWQGGTSLDPITVILNGDTTITVDFEISQMHAVPANISANTTLNLTDNPYVAPGNLYIEKGATLTIEKGVTLLMPQDADIIVSGRLLVNGTSEAGVMIKQDTTRGAKNWGALSFESATDTNRLAWLTVTGTTLGDDPLNQRAGINGNGSNVVIDHLSMYNIVYPLYFEYGSTTLRNSVLKIDHICNGGIHVGRGAAVVENNLWVSTGVTINTDAIDIKGVENGIVRGNAVYNFNGFNSDAIDLGEAAKNILIQGNIVYGSYDKGISIGGKSTAIVMDNLIVGCDLGIGIKDEESHAEIDHNTFVRNRLAVAVYSKAFGRGGGTANVANSILSSSKSGSYFEDRYSTVKFSHCVSDVDVLPGAGNFTGDPGFLDPFVNNFQLHPQSPCLGRGLNADGTPTDIGARYTFDAAHFSPALVPAVSAPAIVINEVMYNDDKKSKSNDWVELHNPSDGEVDLSGWKITDKGDYANWEKSIDPADLDTDEVFIFPEGTKLAAKGYLVIARDPAAFTSVYRDAANCLDKAMPFGLTSVETLLLYDSAGGLVTVVAYRNLAPWPTAPDGKGSSLELIHASRLNYHPLNWSASAGTGTPGRANTASRVIRPRRANAAPLTYLLAQNFPNPCKTVTTIRFSLPEEQHVNIEIYNTSGRLLETIVNERVNAGVHSVQWNAQRHAAGVYFYQIRTKRFTQTKKLTIQ